MTHEVPQVHAVFSVLAVVTSVPSLGGVNALKYQAAKTVVDENVVVLHFAVLRNHHPEKVVGLVPVGCKGGRGEYAAVGQRVQAGVGLGLGGGQSHQNKKQRKNSHGTKVQFPNKRSGAYFWTGSLGDSAEPAVEDSVFRRR